MREPIFAIVQPPVHTEPLGHPPIWDAAMNRCGGRCECTGSCGRTHSKTEFRCDRQHDHGRVRLLVAPTDLATPTTEATRLPLAQLRAWCPDCYRLARRRHLDSIAQQQRFEAPAEGLFDL